MALRVVPDVPCAISIETLWDLRHKLEPAILVGKGVFPVEPVQNVLDRRQSIAVFPRVLFCRGDFPLEDFHRGGGVADREVNAILLYNAAHDFPLAIQLYTGFNGVIQQIG